jgi:hypothetical protein
MGEMRSACKILIEKLEGRRPLGRLVDGNIILKHVLTL